MSMPENNLTTQDQGGREKLGSRMGFIMLSAGCAIGCGNVWKFPWMCGQNGGGSFMLVYLLCLILLGLPAMVMEFSVGRSAQTSPLYMYKKLQKPGQKWGPFGWICLLGNVSLMAFYTVVTGWIIYYFVKFLSGQSASLGFSEMITRPDINVIFLFVTILIAFIILCFDLQGGLERVTKYIMTALLVLMLILGIHSITLSGAAEGLRFYLKPDFSKINGSVIVSAMNQAFFTLSTGMGGMAIFGSYIGKDHSLMGESVHVIFLDTFVAIIAGIIMFPACFTYGLEVNAGPSLLFDTMATVFQNMSGGRIWGTLFFLFMIFAAMSTVLGVCENILAMLRELTAPKAACFAEAFCSSCPDNRPRLQRPAFSALRRRYNLAGFLGFHCVHQCPAPGLSCAGTVLLYRTGLGLEQLCKGGKHRKGAKDKALDETPFPVYRTRRHPFHLYLRTNYFPLEVIQAQIPHLCHR